MSLQTDETAEKLDSMMFLVFEYLRTRATQGQLQRTWQAVLDSFFTTVLNTHKSKFTQYLLWYLLDQVRQPVIYKHRVAHTQRLSLNLSPFSDLQYLALV